MRVFFYIRHGAVHYTLYYVVTSNVDDDISASIKKQLLREYLTFVAIKVVVVWPTTQRRMYDCVSQQKGQRLFDLIGTKSGKITKQSLV